MTIGDIATSLSDKGRAETEEKLRQLDISPDLPVFAGASKNDSAFHVKGVQIEKVSGETEAGVQRDEDGEDSFQGVTILI